MSASSTEEFGPETVIDLLSNQTAWTNTEPDVFHWDEVSQQEKENNPDPAIYVWSPIDIDLEDFSADGDSKRVDETVETQCWTLDRTETRRYAQDVANILEQYLRDNYDNTNWEFIKPESINDARAEKISRRTDHYIATVQIALHKLRDSGV